MTIGQNIRLYRKRRGLSQNQLGQMIEMTGAAVGSYEKGTTIPKRRVTEKIARALDVPVEKITGEIPALSINDMHQDRRNSDALLYDGVLSVMKELYGMVEGRMVVGKNGNSKKYYIIHHLTGSFVLYEKDIAAIVRSAKASLPPLVEYMRKVNDGAVGAEYSV